MSCLLRVKKFKITLLGLNALLNDCYVSEWIDKLQDVVFDAKDLSDEIYQSTEMSKPRCGTSSLLLLILFIKA